MEHLRLNFESDSRGLDQSLGFHVGQIEAQLLKQARILSPGGNHHTWGALLHGGNQSWVGLDPETLQTPYAELKQMLEYLNPAPGTLVIDLGAGYGRLGILLQALYPQVEFVGYELVKERVADGQRIYAELGIKKAHLMVQDLMDESFSMPQADIYFLYDYGKVSHIRHTLDQLSIMAETKNFQLIARGKGIRSLIDLEYPWLTVHDVFHQDNFSIYSTAMK